MRLVIESLDLHFPTAVHDKKAQLQASCEAEEDLSSVAFRCSHPLPHKANAGNKSGTQKEHLVTLRRLRVRLVHPVSLPILSSLTSLLTISKLEDSVRLPSCGDKAGSSEAVEDQRYPGCKRG